MWREWKTEWMKVRYRGIGLMMLVFLGVVTLWSTWGLHGIPREQLDDGYRMMFLQIPLMDTILMPTMIAMLASRLCDAEVKGNTLKLLCTMERKGRLLDMKLLVGGCYVTMFVAAEVLLIFLQSAVYGFARPLEWIQLLYFILQVYFVSIGILLLQILLSFFYENQILPLSAGLFGSFVGLFSWFFSDGILKKCFLWGYYSELCFVVNNWDKETRIVTYDNAPFDVMALCILLILLAAGYVIGKRLFLRKEI